MLILCNGTFKSGSSWLHAIVLEICKIHQLELANIPLRYSLNINSPTRIIEKRLHQFIRDEDFSSNHFLTKSHYFSIDTFNQRYPDSVYFLFIQRDIKDALVSHYFHFLTYRKLTISFKTYFKYIGIYKVYEMILFNRRCQAYSGNAFNISYKDLKLNFTESVNNISLFLGFSKLSKNDIISIENKTSLDYMREKSKKEESKYYPELGNSSYKLFRKGEMGQWKEYLDKSSLRIIEEMNNGNASLRIRLGYYLFFILRRRIGL